MDLYLLLYMLIQSAFAQAVGLRHQENPQITHQQMWFALPQVRCGEWPNRPALFVDWRLGHSS